MNSYTCLQTFFTSLKILFGDYLVLNYVCFVSFYRKREEHMKTIKMVLRGSREGGREGGGSVEGERERERDYLTSVCTTYMKNGVCRANQANSGQLFQAGWPLSAPCMPSFSVTA